MTLDFLAVMHKLTGDLPRSKNAVTGGSIGYGKSKFGADEIWIDQGISVVIKISIHSQYVNAQSELIEINFQASHT